MKQIKFWGRCDLKFSFLVSIQMTLMRTRRDRWVLTRPRKGGDSHKLKVANSEGQLAPESKSMAVWGCTVGEITLYQYVLTLGWCVFWTLAWYMKFLILSRIRTRLSLSSKIYTFIFNWAKWLRSYFMFFFTSSYKLEMNLFLFICFFKFF